MQVISIIVKSAYIALSDNTPSVSPVISVLIKFFIVGDWISYANTTPLLVGTSIITAYTLTLLGLLVYTHLSLALKLKIPSSIQYYWSTLHNLHPSLIFFWIHSFCVDIICYPSHYEVVEGIKASLKAMAYFNTLINCIVAIFFSMISVTYKTKDVLSSKTNMLETKTVIFKILIPILWKAPVENHQGIQIFILILSFLSAILHDWIFVKYLPYYRVRMLLLSAVLQAIQTSLALASCITKFVEARGTDIGVFTFQMVSALLVPLAIKVYYSYIWKILLHIFGCEIKNEKNVYYLVHKRFILLYFLKSRKAIHGGINKFSLADILYQAKLAEIITNSSEFSFAELDINKTLLVRSFKTLCQEILKLHPKTLLAQINLAYSHSKFEDLYIVSNNLLEDAMSKSPGYNAQISLNMIRLELQKKLTSQFSQKTENGLNASDYIINHELYEQVKRSIETQTRLQLDFWKEFLSNKPKMLSLMSVALDVSHQRQAVQKLWKTLLKIRSKSFLSPLVVYGMYSSLINNDPVEGGKCLEQSQEDAKKLVKSFRTNELNNQTIFSDRTIKITMSGLRSKLGRIVDCSANILNFYGWQQNEMKDKPITFLMPPFYRQRHDGFLLDHFNTGKTKTLNTTAIVPVKRSNGYIHPTWLHTKISPNGMLYVGLLRPFKSGQRMILIRKDGKIDDMSFGFARDMNLSGKESHIECDIFTLCPEFRQINEVFNIIADQTIEKAFSDPIQDDRDLAEPKTARTTDRPLLNSRNKNLTIDTTLSSKPVLSNDKRYFDQIETQHLYETFIVGSMLAFYPLNASDPIAYSVKITNHIHGNEVLKYVLLEKTSSTEKGSFDEKILTESSDHEAAFPSFKIFDKKSTNNEKKKKKNKFPSAVLFPSKVGFVPTPSSPSIWNTETAELMKVTTSPRIKTETKLSNHDGTNLSILDEVQSHDSAAKKVVFSSIVEGNDRSFSNKKHYQYPLVQKTQSQFLDLPGLNGEDQELQVAKPKKSKLKFDHKEYSIASSYLYKAKKTEQMMIQALKAQPRKKSASILRFLFVVFLIAEITLLSFQSSNLSAGIQEVQSQFPIISSAFFQQYALISSASQVLAWKGTLEGYFSTGDWVGDNLYWSLNLQYYILYLKQFSTQFYELSSKLPVEIQSQLYKKNVGIYEYDEDGNKTLVSLGSAFEAYQMMLEREISCLDTKLPAQFEDGIDTSNFKFIMDNVLNDLLIQLESQVERLSDYMHDSTHSTTFKAGFLMGSVLFVCLIFVVVSIRYLCLIASEARIFMTMIFRMKSQDCEAIYSTLQGFQSWLNTENMKNQEDILNQEKLKGQEENGSKRFRSASLGSLYRFQRVSFLKLLPIFCLFICWSVVYFTLTYNFIGNIKDSEKRMEAALQALNNQTLFINEFASLLLSNNTLKIKNEPLMPMLDESLNYLEQVDLFIDRFRDRNGELTVLQQKVLFNFPCEDFLPYVAKDYEAYVYAYASCFVNGKGKDLIGLVAINAEFYNSGLYILKLYENSPKSAQDLMDILFIVFQMMNDLSISAEGFLKLLYEATNESFAHEVDSTKGTIVYLTVCIVIVTLLVALVTWYFTIKGIFRLQKIDWLILQLFPIRLIQCNKHLQQYLLRHSDGMLNGIKGYMSQGVENF